MKKVNDNMDMCDIMIEKRWRDIMNTESTNEGWEEVLYSKNQINKAGKVISNLKDAEVKEIVDALKVLNNWRAAHAYPLHVI